MNKVNQRLAEEAKQHEAKRVAEETAKNHAAKEAEWKAQEAERLKQQQASEAEAISGRMRCVAKRLLRRSAKRSCC